MIIDIDLEPFPNIGNNPFYKNEFSIGNMLPQVPVVDKDVIRRNIDSNNYDLFKVRSGTIHHNIMEIYKSIFFNNNDTVIGENVEGLDMKRSNLPDDVFGIPEERKYPMPDKQHTISAIKLFNHCEKKHEKELAKHIIKNINRYHIDISFIGPNNRLRKYLDNGGVGIMQDTNYILDNMMYNFFGEKSKKSDSDILFESFFGEYSSDENIKSVPDEIEEIVKKLENKKYGVKYASPGYSGTSFKNDKNDDGVLNGKMISTGRIIFDKDYAFDTTPKGWEWRILHNGAKALYTRPFTYNEDNGTPNEAFVKWKNNYLSSLRKWVEELPVAGIKNRGNSKVDENFSSGF